MNIDKLGVSLIDNQSCVEIAYIWFYSSYVLWGHLDSHGNYQTFKHEQISDIEDAYVKFGENSKKSNYRGYKEVGKIDKKFEVIIKLNKFWKTLNTFQLKRLILM